MGSKSFATRARESDPTLVPADQILGIVDTLIAGDKRINNQHLDLYALLQVPSNQTHDSELIADQYRRLAMLLNPQNNNFPYADQAFRLVADAFSVLSNPMRKSMYDKELGFFVNLYPGASAASTSTPMSFVHHSAFASARDQQFVSFHSQEPEPQHAAAGVSFNRDPQPPAAVSSMPVTFLSHNQEVVTPMPSSGRHQQEQPVTFLSREQAQPQPVTTIPFSNTVEQPATFLSLNQPHPVTSVRSSNRENAPFSFGSSSTRGQEPAVSVEQQQVNKRPPPRRNEDLVGNSADQSTGNRVNVSNVQQKEGNVNVSGSRIPSFWTACPYCYIMYEYPLDYADCTLRCQNCKRAFQAVTIPSPPPIGDGKEAYFCCWGFMPLGVSLSSFQRNNVSSWTPFSPMFTCPQTGGNGGTNVNNHVVGGQSSVNNSGNLHNAGRSKSGDGRHHSGPRIYVDDEDDVFVEISDASEESDEDWNRGQERKKTKNVKRRNASTGTPSTNAKKQQPNKAKGVEGNSGVNVQDGLAAQGGVEMPHVVAAALSKRGFVTKTIRQPGRVPKQFEKLDLNVEFSNEVDEPTPGISKGNEAGMGEDNTVEVIGFFEGLDEFLSSLPILNVVDGGRVEAA